MKQYTQKDIDTELAGRSIFPKGKYAPNCRFGNSLKFSAGCIFGVGTTFGHGCRFLSRCVFDHDTTFGRYTKFGKHTDFQTCSVGEGSVIGDYSNAFRIRLGPSSVVGKNCTFYGSSTIEDSCDIGDNFRLGSFSTVQAGTTFGAAVFGEYTHFYGDITHNGDTVFGKYCYYGTQSLQCQNYKMNVSGNIVQSGPITVSGISSRNSAHFFDTGIHIIVVTSIFDGTVEDFLADNKEFTDTVEFVTKIFERRRASLNLAPRQPI